MSIEASWLALAIDWMDSPMFDGPPAFEHYATHGERLAWVCLLCWAKAQGRAGRVCVRKNVFVERFHLSMRAVEGMIARAQKCEAIEVNGDFITLCNWRVYQNKAWKSDSRKHSASGKTGEKAATHHPSPITHHHKTPLPPGLDDREFFETWSAWEQHRREIKKPLTPMAARQCLEKCQQWGKQRAIIALKHTMAMGWQGLREPDGPRLFAPDQRSETIEQRTARIARECEAEDAARANANHR